MSEALDIDIPPSPRERTREPIQKRDNVTYLDKTGARRNAIVIGMEADTVDLLLPDAGTVHRNIPARAVRRAG